MGSMAAGGWRVTRGGSRYNLQEGYFCAGSRGVAAKKIAGTSTRLKVKSKKK